MATGRVPTTANSPLTAKGDLFGYSTTQARVPVGNDGETLVADSSASTGLRWQGNFAAGKNLVINGDFNIWQRGTSFTVTGTESVVYKADRWAVQANGSTTTRTISRQSFTPGTAPVAGYEGLYFLRYAQTTAGNNTYNFLTTRIENVQNLAGQTATLSFWAKADAARTMGSYLSQNFGSGGSATVNTSTQNNSLTTSWQRFTYTVAVPSISGKTVGSSSFLEITFELPNGNITPTIDIWGVQLEAGNVATAFQTATGTLAGELAACQRYYYRVTSGTAYSIFSTGANVSTTQARVNVPLAVTMRVAPTSSIDYATLGLAEPGAGVIAATSVTFSDSNPNNVNLLVNVASGLTAQRTSYLYSNNSTTAYLGFTAEL